MITYTYIVKCPECEDEFFDFFEEAKAFALGCLSQKPVITQTEVNRNDFGECTDHCDLGTVWSWEDVMKETDTEPAKSIFTKDDLKDYIPDEDPEFDELDNSVNYEPELTETVPVTAFRAPKDSDYVIVLKHPNNQKYYFLARNYTITSDINKAMTYPGKFSAEDEIKYAVDAAEKRGLNFAPKHNPGSDSYFFGWVKVPRTNPEQYYDDYRSVNFFVATVAEAKKLLAGEADDSLTEDEQRLATNSKGDYLVRASSGLGYTVFNRSNVAIGGFEEDDDTTAITRFRRGNIKEHVNQENPAIESDQKLDGIDNAVVDCKVAKVISHSEDEKPLNEESAEESCRKPVPEGMSLKDLVEAMEENEDTVECVGCEELFPKDECVHKDDIGWLCGDCEDSVVKCTWCEELFDRSECRMEVDLGWLCDRCEAGIKSRGETLTFREGNYWDFLDEEVDDLLTESEETPEVNKQTAAEALADKINQKANAEEKAAMLKKIAEQIPPDKVAAVTKDIKSKIKDYNLTEEDKNILKTKTKIDPKLIDKADSILTLINSFLDNVQVSLPVLGAIIDIVHLVVPDEALAAVCPPLGAVLAILSYIPEGIVVSILLDFGITALRGISTLAKDAVVSLVDLKDTVNESFSEESESHLKFCPECGKDTFDIETGICITCGFN